MPDNTKKPEPVRIEMLSSVELQIIDILRTLLPFEKMEIMADKQGRPEVFIITRSHKIVVGEMADPIHIKDRK